MANKTSTFEMTILDSGRYMRREILGAPRRFLGKCRCCKRPLSALVTEIINVSSGSYGLTGTVALSYCNGILDAFPCNDCGAVTIVRAVVGKVSPRHVSNAKCPASTSGRCECSCGGRNHGASYAA